MYYVYNDYFPYAGSGLNLQNVCAAITDIVDWHTLGLKLGLSKSELDQVYRDFSNDTDERCKSEIIDEWLKPEYNPSWKGLCTALEAMDNQTIARDVYEKYIAVHL